MTPPPTPAALVLSDGTTLEGEAIGAPVPVTTGEVVFNTVLSGYQEVLSDPSYAGQIITFTHPHIGNYGVNAADEEARRPFCRGVIVRDLARRHSSWRSEGTLEAWLTRHGVAGIAGIDTRRLTRHLRDAGAMPGAFGTAPEAELATAARAEPGTTGVDLVSQVTTAEPYTVGDGPRRVVAYDLGIKTSILRQLASWATVEVVPASTPAAQVIDRAPEGIFVSNGPGDPAEVPDVVTTVGELVDAKVPLFGICLGHQVLGRALGGGTVKLDFGHHGGNHPVREEATGRVEITSQNHNFAVDVDSLGDRARVTHINLNDGVCEGLTVPGRPAFSVQHHPEAGPGPHDARHLFARFAELIDRGA